ncbi:MAG: hypothetical protein HZB41_14300 [Ignavibacteriae bacterium]|nr:hypothetical protein [Ignavibacteriota bacterium]
MNIAQKAQKLYSKSEVIELDKNSIANYKLVQTYRLTGAPTPLILVIGKNGTVVGGAVYNETTAEDLVAKIPTPKLEEVYASVADSKPAILIFTKKSFTDRIEVLKTCNEAVSILKNNASIIEVNMDDSKEDNFMKMVRINKSSKSSVVLVINKQGQLSGTATTMPDAKKLAAAATAVPKGGCGPGCGPAGCGK